jgi:hypothetical protein
MKAELGFSSATGSPPLLAFNSATGVVREEERAKQKKSLQGITSSGLLQP